MTTIGWLGVALALSASAGWMGCALFGAYDFGGYHLEAAEAGPEGGPPDSGPCSLDLTTDPRNCGRCGHDCLGGACMAALCQPVVIDTNLTTCSNEGCGPWSLALSPTSLYFTEYTTGKTNGAVYASPLDAGAGVHSELAPYQAYALAVGTDTIDVYWTASPDGVINKIYRCPTAGCAAEPEQFGGDAGFDYPAAFAFSDASVYWTESGYTVGDGGFVAGNVWMQGKASPAPQSIAAGESFPLGLVAADRLYWADNGTPPTYTDGAIVVADLGGGNRQVLASGQANPQSVALYDGQLYWTDLGTFAKSYLDGAIWTCTPSSPMSCAMTLQEVARSQAGPYALAADASGIYWTSSYGSYVWQCVPMQAQSLVPCTATRISPEQAGPWALAVDETSVYWTSLAAGVGSVLRMAKP